MFLEEKWQCDCVPHGIRYEGLETSYSVEKCLLDEIKPWSNIAVLFGGRGPRN